jgi:putative transposase
MGRVGSCLDNATPEVFFSTLEHQVLSRHQFTTTAQTRKVVVDWCQDFYSSRRRRTSVAMMSPIQYKTLAADQPAAA